MSNRITTVAGVFACLLAAAPANAATLKDSADRTETVAPDITSVVPAKAPAQVLLHALAPGKLTGIVEAFAPEHAVYVDPTIASLPQIPTLTRTDAPGDVAAAAALKPGLVVDYGSVSARYVAADEKIDRELHTPAVLYDGRFTGAGAVAKALGAAIGEAQRGEDIAGTIAGVLAAVKPVADVVALEPSVVIFADAGALSSPLHAALPKGTRFVLDAGEPYKVLTRPPSVNRVVGVAALAPILHPDKVKADPGAVLRLAASLFPPPPGVTEPAPLQVRE